MPIAIDPNETTEYVLKCDRDLPVDGQTVFLIAPQTVAQTRAAETKLQPVVRGDVTIQGSNVDFVHQVLRHGLRGWRNFKNRAGVQIAWQASHRDGQPTDETLARLSLSYRAELAEAIQALGKIESADVGKSER